MAAEAHQTCYEGSIVQNFLFYLEQSGDHKIILQFLHHILPGQFKRIGAGRGSLDVLGVGSGGGNMDVELLTLLQSTLPAVPITADIVEGSSELTDIFKALVAKTTNLQTIPFAWHFMKSEDYEMEVKAKGDMKRFDFIHMVHMIYFLDNLDDSIKFYHSLLKKNGMLMIIVQADGTGWDILWKTYAKELCINGIEVSRSSREVISCLKSQGLKYEEHAISNTFDISECFNPSSQTGERLLNFFTAKDHFYQSFTPEIRAGMLELLRNKSSTKKDGRVFFSCGVNCIFVYA
ncbi:histamine N-methyltransferase-like [Sebastes fasciatus]|uniref:histamine N-methyltransferase-like n=1 Tax=Sebastes fasciatus TaxID=394691 RepID=UPI003D9EAD5D